MSAVAQDAWLGLACHQPEPPSHRCHDCADDVVAEFSETGAGVGRLSCPSCGSTDLSPLPEAGDDDDDDDDCWLVTAAGPVACRIMAPTRNGPGGEPVIEVAAAGRHGGLVHPFLVRRTRASAKELVDVALHRQRNGNAGSVTALALELVDERLRGAGD